MATQFGGMVGEEKRMLAQKKMGSLVAADLEAMDTTTLVGAVCEEVGSGYHLKHFTERGRLWSEICKDQERLQEVVQVIFQVYIDNLRTCARGREKFARLQLEWMGFVCSVVHVQELFADSSVARVQFLWQTLIASSVPQGRSGDDFNTLFYSVSRAVFNYCQRKVVAIKEGSELDEKHQDLQRRLHWPLTRHRCFD